VVQLVGASPTSFPTNFFSSSDSVSKDSRRKINKDNKRQIMNILVTRVPKNQIMGKGKSQIANRKDRSRLFTGHVGGGYLLLGKSKSQIEACWYLSVSPE
jgi:hypothetical protein